MSNTELIKELRSLTQAGMKDCKDALEESNWDLQKAVDLVKIKGLNIVSGREGKLASEGCVAIECGLNAKLKVMVEVNCQTDFVANSPAFKEFAGNVAKSLMLKTDDNEPFNSTDLDVENLRVALVSITKENVVVRRWWAEEVLSPCAKVFSYTHSNGKIGVLLTLSASSEKAAEDPSFIELANDLAMQVAAMNPLSVSVDRLNSAAIERQKTIFETQLSELNKPQAAWPKILEGKFNKWYTDVCLLNQESIVVAKSTVDQVIKNVETKLGETIQVINFNRCQVGEGLDNKQEDLANEVAKMM
jgi:elongation factor Ts